MTTIWLSKAEVLAQLAVLDNPPTERQFDRWCREKLLPRPRRIFLGKKHGTRSEYPPETPAIAARIHQLLSMHRDFDLVRVALWVDGQPQLLEKLKTSLAHLALRPFKEFMRKGTDDATIEKHAEIFMQIPDRRGLRRQLRKQVETDKAVQDLIRMVLHLAVGGTVFFQQPPQSVNGENPTGLMVKGMGLHTATWLGSEVNEQLAQMENSDILSYEFQRRTLTEATMAQFDQALYDVKTIGILLQRLSTLLKRLDLPPFFGELFAAIDLVDPLTLARWVVVFLVVQRGAGDAKSDELRAVAEENSPKFEQILSQLDSHPELYDTLRQSFAEVASAFTLNT